MKAYTSLQAITAREYDAEYWKPEAIAGRYLTGEEVAERWRCCVATVFRRLRKFGVKPMKLSQRSCLFRAADIIKVERDCAA
jgi:hypothetical protein